MQNTIIFRPSIHSEPAVISERFKKAKAEYRSQGVMTPAEWPMNTVAGRQMFRSSQSRDRFLTELADLDSDQIRFCKKCGHSDVGHGPKGCRAGSCLCWMNREAMRFEKNLEPIAGGAN